MVPTLPSLQALRILDAAARLRSYTAAAEELGLTHGAVSRQIQSLEHWAGTKLFERKGKHMEPTVEGLELAARTRDALGMLGDFALRSASQTSSGLIVSTTAAFARFWLIPRLARLEAEHPGLIREIDAATTFFESGSKKVDVAIRYGGGGWTDVQYERIGSDMLVPAAAPTLANTMRTNAAEHLLRAPLIETPYHSWRKWFAAAGIKTPSPLRPALTASDTNLAIEMCLNGYGVALVRARLVARALMAGQLVRVHNFSPKENYEYYAVWRGTTRQRKNIQLLKAWVAKEMVTETLPVSS